MTSFFGSRSLLALSFFAAALGTGACSSTSDAAGIDGNYKGTYAGDATGPVSMTISGDKVDVVATVGGTNYPGSGSVDSAGGVSVGVGTGSGVTVTFSGTFANAKGSGTWQSTAGTKGSWSVSK